LVALLCDLQGIEISGQAENTGDAIHSIRGLSPDAVILDLQIGGGNGLDVLRDIRQRGASPVVMVFTNDPFPGSEQRCRDAGADYFLDKTNDVEKLIDIVKGLEQASRE
jgi:DNA-binding NarL/FixJ family response regulator